LAQPNRAIRIAAVGDLHCRKTSAGAIAPRFAMVNDHADVLLLCGDLTDYGTVEEAHVLAKEIAGVRVPMLGVLGNHDYHSNASGEVVRVLRDAGVQILDGDAIEVAGVGFAGVKGFCGGFGRGTLGPWGELATKSFVQEAIDEALRLESALARLRTDRRVVVMHYAPIRETVEGEPVEIFPFLGCSRLEEPLHRYPVDLVFHGHAHHGRLEGKTSTGIRVFNVAAPLLTSTLHEPLRIVELPAPTEQLELRA
jgi:Icc-related predicted phosphoesterase